MAETTQYGVVTEMYPNAHFLVRLDDGRLVTPSLYARLTVGTGVMVELSRFDLSRGRIVSRDAAPGSSPGAASCVLR